VGLSLATSRAIDGLEPSRVVRPRDAAEVADVIRAANGAREAVVLWGGGTRIGVGDAPARYDAAVDLSGLSGVVEHTAADLVCTVRAGTTLAELADALAPSGQRWPVHAADPERATVGGTIASAAPAPSRLRFQHPRDWTIGCEAVLGDGTRARAGGRVVKNVSGFDLTRLYAGTYGTLAALVEVAFHADEVLGQQAAEHRLPGGLQRVVQAARENGQPGHRLVGVEQAILAQGGQPVRGAFARGVEQRNAHDRAVEQERLERGRLQNVGALFQRAQRISHESLLG
jgi:FAD/FMN-containing dehydrogenase